MGARLPPAPIWASESSSWTRAAKIETQRSSGRPAAREALADLLVFLLERPGELVPRGARSTTPSGPRTPSSTSKSWLHAAVQPAARRRLGERADDPTFIQTIPREGYRFIAPVSEELKLAQNRGRPGFPRPPTSPLRRRSALRARPPRRGARTSPRWASVVVPASLPARRRRAGLDGAVGRGRREGES